MDFAVTSPLQQMQTRAATQSPLAAAMEYAERKHADRNTGQRCQDLGIKLVPMIAESLGGWGPEAQKAFKILASAHASRTGTQYSKAISQLYEGLSTKLLRAAARSLLARVADSGVVQENHERQRAVALLAAGHQELQ